MPIYQFENEHGEAVEVFFGMDEAPECGSTIEHEGQKLFRIVSQQAGVVREYRHIARQLPRVDPKDPYWPKFDSSNRPYCTSKKEVGELQSRIAHMGGGFKFG